MKHKFLSLVLLGSMLVALVGCTALPAAMALMIKRIFEGKPISSILPEAPKEFGYAFDLKKTQQFGIQVPVDLIELAGDNIVH